MKKYIKIIIVKEFRLLNEIFSLNANCNWDFGFQWKVGGGTLFIISFSLIY